LTVRKADPRHNRVHTANQEPVNALEMGWVNVTGKHSCGHA